MKRTNFETEHDTFMASTQRFVDTQIATHHEEWSSVKKVDEEISRGATSHP